MPASYSILIADQDIKTLRKIDSSLCKEGYITFLAETGMAVIQIVHKEPVHLSILDVFLPDYMGLEVLRMLHDMRFDMPCIMVGENVSKEQRMDAMAMGVSCMLSKPFDTELLIDVVRHVLSRYYRPNLH